jgi:crotonobetainyl-CoA:carnitine CoA-transferase CaiB-like acyl-CoA transferase
MNAPLQGIQVVELATVLAGPATGQFLAEAGASVTKIEPPGGDITRSWCAPGEHPHQHRSAYFCAANWGKKSKVMDLTQSRDQSKLHAMLPTTDVLLMSFKPGDARKLGLDPAQLRKEYPRLIIGTITGYGEEDPRTGYDAIIQAEAGFVHLNGIRSGEGHKMPVALMDLLAAHQLKEGILLALWERGKSGTGHWVRVSLIDAALSALANQATNYLIAGYEPQAMGSGHPNIVPYGQTYNCSDGVRVVLAVGSDKQFTQLMDQLNINAPEEWRHAAGRIQNRSAIEMALSEAVGKQTSETLLAGCMGRQIPAGRVNTLPQAVELAKKRGMLHQVHGLSAPRTAVFMNGNPHIDPPPPLPNTA